MTYIDIYYRMNHHKIDRNIYGLTLFIKDLRNIENPEEEAIRVNQEFAKIRLKFNASNVSGYERRKNVWKMIYCHMLGYDIDFCLMEIINLLTSSKYQEKLTGYLGANTLLADHDELIRLCVNTIQEDISSNNEGFISLALSFIACTPSLEISERLYYHLVGFINPSYGNVYIKKKAFLAISQILNTSPNLLKADNWVPVIENILTTETDESCLVTAGAFMEILFKKKSTWDNSLNLIVNMLLRVIKGDVPHSNMYHSVPAPWLTIKYLHLLSIVTPDPNAPYLRSLETLLMSILTKQITYTYERPKSSAKLSKKEIHIEQVANSVGTMEYAILLKALSVSIVWRKYINSIDVEALVRILTSCISSKSSNVRYMGLEIMAKLSKDASQLSSMIGDLKMIIKFLQNEDMEVRKKSADILYNLCNKRNWKMIIPELLVTLRYSSTSLQKDLVNKIALLTEKFAAETSWHMDTIFNLIDYMPDIMQDNAIWHRVIWWLSGKNTEHYIELQKYAVNRAFKILNENKTDFSYAVSVPLQKLCGYLLGEFGNYLSHAERNGAFDLIKGYFLVSKRDVKCIFLMAMAKFALDDKFKAAVLEFLKHICDSDSDVEIQTRAHEMFKLLSTDKHFYENVLGSMPKFPNSLKKNVGELVENENDICVIAPRHVTKTLDDLMRERTETLEREAIKVSKPNEKLENATNEERWKLFLSNDVTKGVFYTEKYITVHLNQLFKGHVGKIQVIVHPCDESHTLKISSIAFQQVPGVVFSTIAFEPTTIRGTEKASVKASFQILQPFIAPPTCTIVAQVVTSKKTKDLNVVFNMPILVSKLISSVQLKTSQFADIWNSVPNDCIVNSKLKVKFETLDALIGSISQYLDMHLTISGDTIYASSSMITGMLDGDRNPTTTPCVMMMKFNKSHVTLEVRSSVPLASKSLAYAIKSLLGPLPF